MDVLIADDEPFILQSLAFVLRKEGFDVETATDGQDALKKAQELNPKIIFLDVMMPKVSGFSVCRLIKSDRTLRSIHVIILTAKGQEQDRETGLKEGADDYVTKPFSPRELVEKVRKVMKRTD